MKTFSSDLLSRWNVQRRDRLLPHRRQLRERLPRRLQRHCGMPVVLVHWIKVKNTLILQYISRAEDVLIFPSSVCLLTADCRGVDVCDVESCRYGQVGCSMSSGEDLANSSHLFIFRNLINRLLSSFIHLPQSIL